MVTKVSLICKVDINKRNHGHTTDGGKKKSQNRFKEILAKETKKML